MEPRDPPRGLLGSMRVVAGALMALAVTRLDLAATELEEERLRLAELALWAVLALFLLAVGIVFGGVLAVVLAWNGPREWVLGLLTAVFLGTGLLAARTWRRKARDKPRMLAATLAELHGDCVAFDAARRTAR